MAHRIKTGAGYAPTPTPGEMPSGFLYAEMQGITGITLDNYNTCLDSLKNVGFITESGHMLKWTDSERGNEFILERGE